MTIVELAKALSIPPRQIRFMVAEGILPPAKKTGRSADAYDEIHLKQAQRYLALHRTGMKPGAIKILMAFDTAVPVLQIDGVELRISQDVDPSTIDVEDILAKIETALKAYLGKGTKS